MRCYFHLVNSHEIVPDDTGVEIADPADIQEFALQAIEEIRDEAIQAGASWQGWRIDVVGSAGDVLLSIPLEPRLH